MLDCSSSISRFLVMLLLRQAHEHCVVARVIWDVYALTCQPEAVTAGEVKLI